MTRYSSPLQLVRDPTGRWRQFKVHLLFVPVGACTTHCITSDNMQELVGVPVKLLKYTFAYRNQLHVGARCVVVKRCLSSAGGDQPPFILERSANGMRESEGVGTSKQSENSGIVTASMNQPSNKNALSRKMIDS